MLILTAADSVEERVKGLDYGADDYMAKPFSLQELEARCAPWTRRGMGATSTTIKHGPLVYDQAGRVATIDGKMVELSARELGLLEVLLQRAGRLVSKDQLVERLCEWGEEVSNNAIEVYIHRLRKKIEKGLIRIATVRGLGYCLEKIPPDRFAMLFIAACSSNAGLDAKCNPNVAENGRPAGETLPA